MAQSNVSQDVLRKVKVAISDYRQDTSAFPSKVHNATLSIMSKANEVVKKVRDEINELESDTKQLKLQIEALEDQIVELKKVLATVRDSKTARQIQQQIDELRRELSDYEQQLRNKQKQLDNAKNKEQRLKSAFRKMESDTQSFVSASKSFESKSTAKVDKINTSIDKCIQVIDEYISINLAGSDVSSRDTILMAGTSRMHDPSMVSRSVAGRVTPPGGDSSSVASTVQFVTDAAIPTTEAFMGAVHRQHAPSHHRDDFPREGVNYIRDSNNNIVPIGND